jgi:hypothetical protein
MARIFSVGWEVLKPQAASIVKANAVMQRTLALIAYVMINSKIQMHDMTWLFGNIFGGLLGH